MRKIIRNAFFVLVIVGIFSFPMYSFAYVKSKINVAAQNDFVVEPGKTEVIINPGETITKNVTITNRIGKTVKFKLTTEDLIGSDDSQQPLVLLGDDSSPYSLKDFIIPEITSFSLSFGERIVIPVKISVPLNAEPRGYYGALVVANDPEKLEGESAKEAEGKTRIVSRIGSIFLVKIKGEGKEEGQLSGFKVIGPTKAVYTKRPSGFEIAFKNTGNVHLVPYGTITIKNIFGRTVQELPVNAYFALPDSTRYREILWEQGFGLGRYTANLSLYKGYGTEYAESKVAFWIIPWKILLMALIGIITIVTIGYYIATRFELRRK
ncbi:MAG: hypothetical protein AAB681_01620 [Patescibacteria group bacterium]